MFGFSLNIHSVMVCKEHRKYSKDCIGSTALIAFVAKAEIGKELKKS